MSSLFEDTARVEGKIGREFTRSSPAVAWAISAIRHGEASVEDALCRAIAFLAQDVATLRGVLVDAAARAPIGPFSIEMTKTGRSHAGIKKDVDDWNATVAREEAALKAKFHHARTGHEVHDGRLEDCGACK